jgi:tyrosine-protein phosphatase SIW14
MAIEHARRQRRTTFLVVCLAVAGLIIAAALWGHDYVLPKRFAEVVPGHLYRSGLLEQWPLKRVIDQYQIRTIVCMLHYDPDDARQEHEREIAAQKGVRIVQIGMGGDGLGPFEDLEKAAAVLADEAAHPVLVHCSAGVNRTGAVFALWRMKYCGWDAERAIAEAESHGKTNPKLAGHLRRYYQERIVAARPTSQPASQAASVR